MASRLDNLTAVFSNVKMRTIIIMTVVVLLIVIVIALLNFRRNNTEASNNAKLAKASNLQSVPGLNPTTTQYAQIQQQVNEQNYQRALKSEGTAVPTVIHAGSLSSGKNPSDYSLEEEQEMAGQNAGTNPNGVNARNNPNAKNANNANMLGANKGLSPEQVAMLQQQQDQMEAMQKKLDMLASQQAQQELQQTQQAMQREAQQLMTAWTSNTSTPTQAYVRGNYKPATPSNKQANGSGSANNAGNAASNGGNGATSTPILKAGTIYFGVLETSVNSDEPGPVMVKIETGPYKGARLIGAIQPAKKQPGTNGPDKLILNFNVMNVPRSPESVSISAVAIDPDTARTALASEVNYHYLQRYGSLFGSSFLEGWGQAVSQAGSTTTTNLFGTTNTQYGKLSGIDEVIAGFGQLGQNWGQQMGEIFHRQPTVVIKAGVSIGVLFLSDVSLNNVVPPAGTQESIPMELTQQLEQQMATPMGTPAYGVTQPIMTTGYANTQPAYPATSVVNTLPGNNTYYQGMPTPIPTVTRYPATTNY